LLDIITGYEAKKADEIKELNERIGRRLKELRKASGLTSQELAHAIGTSELEVRYVEHHKTPLTAAELILACKRLDITVEDLLARELKES